MAFSIVLNLAILTVYYVANSVVRQQTSVSAACAGMAPKAKTAVRARSEMRFMYLFIFIHSP